MISGVVTAILTPFDKFNKVNFESLEMLVLKQLKEKVDGILLLGTTAETPSLSDEEELEIVDFVYNLAKDKTKLIIGVSGNNTSKVIEKCNMFNKYKVEAFLVITPYYNRPNESGMISHFINIANNVKKPIILYNVPRRTGVSLSIDVIKVLKKHDNIIGIKEASGNMHFYQQVVRLQDDDFYVYCGEDAFNYLSLCLHAKGLISVLSNVIPEVVVQMVNEYNNNEVEKALELHNKYFKLTELLFIETSPIPLKELMNFLNYNVGDVRLPLGKINEENLARLLHEARMVFFT